MSDIQNDAASQVADRKELLAQQFDEADQTTAALVPTGEGRARDESGKFVPKVADKVQTPGDAASIAQGAVEEPAWNKAPASWKKEKHVLWSGMTPEQREYAYQREEQMRSGVEPLLPKAEFADKISKAVEPYMNTIRGLGLELPQAVAGLMKVDHDLRTLPHDQKLTMLHHVAMGYGIDLSGQIQGARQAYDPVMQNLQNELLSIKGQFSSFTEQQRAAEDRSALEEIQKFSTTAEHFEDVKPMMIQLLQGGLANNIQEAYDKAIRLNPELFDQMQSARQATADAEKRGAADAAAKRAKAAAVSVRSATPGTTKATNAQDRRSMLREQLDGVSDRL